MIRKRLILTEIEKLQEQGIITAEISKRIREYYLSYKKPKTTILPIIFGILGSILIGSGIILLIAHNWDDLPRWVRTIISLAPLITAQSICGYTIVKKPESPVWRESSAVFLFCAVGASISLISQTYNISGDFGRFILTWSLLLLPVIYLCNSTTVSMFYLIWIAIWTSYQVSEHLYPWLYFPLVAAIIPFGYQLYKHEAHLTKFTLFSWTVAIFGIITLPWIFSYPGFNHWELIRPLAFTLLFVLYFLTGKTPFYDAKNNLSNPWLILGSVGIFIILLFLSFDNFWLYYQMYHQGMIANGYSIVSIAILSALFGTIIFLLIRFIKTSRRYCVCYPLSLIAIFIGYFIIFIPIPLLSDLFVFFMQVLINIFLLIIGVITIVQGIKQEKHSTTNFGMFIISSLILCRFLDSDLSFIVRGIGFIAVGLGFFIANYVIIRKSKDEK
jgi:uncharacterized membrane protein